MDLLAIPASDNLFVSVAANSVKGTPDEIPRKRAASGALSK
jgi:hypothetical protein